MSSLVTVNEVGKSYQTLMGETIEAVRNVSFELHEGEILALVGPSGCGKSTLLRLVAGVEPPSQGRIYRRQGERGDRFIVGYVFQDSSLMRWRSVYDNIKLPLEVLAKDNPKKINELIQTLNLTGFEPRIPDRAVRRNAKESRHSKSTCSRAERPVNG